MGEERINPRIDKYLLAKSLELNNETPPEEEKLKRELNIYIAEMQSSEQNYSSRQSLK